MIKTVLLYYFDRCCAGVTRRQVFVPRSHSWKLNFVSVQNSQTNLVVADLASQGTAAATAAATAVGRVTRRASRSLSLAVSGGTGLRPRNKTLHAPGSSDRPSQRGASAGSRPSSLRRLMYSSCCRLHPTPQTQTHLCTLAAVLLSQEPWQRRSGSADLQPCAKRRKWLRMRSWPRSLQGHARAAHVLLPPDSSTDCAMALVSLLLWQPPAHRVLNTGRARDHTRGKMVHSTSSCPDSRQYQARGTRAMLCPETSTSCWTLLLRGQFGEQLVSVCNLFVIIFRHCLGPLSAGSSCTD